MAMLIVRVLVEYTIASVCGVCVCVCVCAWMKWLLDGI